MLVTWICVDGFIFQLWLSDSLYRCQYYILEREIGKEKLHGSANGLYSA